LLPRGGGRNFPAPLRINQPACPRWGKRGSVIILRRKEDIIALSFADEEKGESEGKKRFLPSAGGGKPLFPRFCRKKNPGRKEAIEKKKKGGRGLLLYGVPPTASRKAIRPNREKKNSRSKSSHSSHMGGPCPSGGGRRGRKSSLLKKSRTPKRPGRGLKSISRKFLRSKKKKNDA